MSVAYNNNPQSIISSRLYTNNAFKPDESRKQGDLKRDKINLNLIFDENKKMVKSSGGSGVKNNNLEILDQENNGQIGKRLSDGDFDHKSISFDDRIVLNNKSCFFICCNRLLYSRKCVYFYIFLIVFSIAVFLYSIIGYFTKMGKIKNL
jgi:hypothetical protein